MGMIRGFLASIWEANYYAQSVPGNSEDRDRFISAVSEEAGVSPKQP
jgi:hypothetical protein